MSATWRILQGDAVERLRELPDESVHCCVTSPPYFGLRDYGVEGQLGLEASPEAYVDAIVAVFVEVGRVLREDGTLWLNLGDSYAANGGHSREGTTSQRVGRANLRQQNRGTTACPVGFKPKDLIGIPWMVAFALRASGWFLRSDVVWSKPNPMPESVTDRPTRSHEYVFLLSKSRRYHYDADAIREPHEMRPQARPGGRRTDTTPRPGQRRQRWSTAQRDEVGVDGHPLGRNRRTVWTIATQPYPEAHFATFPPKLVEPCILAGTSPEACGVCGAPWQRVVERTFRPQEDVADSPALARSAEGLDPSSGWADTPRGTTTTRTTGWEPTCEHGDDSGRCLVLDPFAGAGTTGLVALRLDRSFVGIELNPEYVELARNRLCDDAPLLNTAAEAAA